MQRVPYNKQIQTFSSQISILKQRGMMITDESAAESWLRRVSYYRMSGYWYPLLADRQNHVFKTGSTFEQACMLYDFDSRLRQIVLSYIERIEVAIRTQMAYVMSMAYDGYWFEDAHLFGQQAQHAKTISNIQDEYQRSDEQFVRAFRRKYSDPLPPSWITLEITSFGTMSILYQNLKPGLPKREVASAFGVSDTVFVSWLHTLVYIRNICAHHARLWNRILGVRPLMPRRTHRAFIEQRQHTACLLCFGYHTLLDEHHRTQQHHDTRSHNAVLQLSWSLSWSPWIPKLLATGTIVEVTSAASFKS